MTEPQRQILPPSQPQPQQMPEPRTAVLPRPQLTSFPSTRNETQRTDQTTSQGGEEMQQNIPPATKRGRGRPRKTDTQTRTTENKTQEQSTTTHQQNENILLESQSDAPAGLLERRVTRSMTKAAESAPATVTQGDVVQIE